MDRIEKCETRCRRKSVSGEKRMFVFSSCCFDPIPQRCFFPPKFVFLIFPSHDLSTRERENSPNVSRVTETAHKLKSIQTQTRNSFFLSTHVQRRDLSMCFSLSFFQLVRDHLPYLLHLFIRKERDCTGDRREEKSLMMARSSPLRGAFYLPD